VIKGIRAFYWGATPQPAASAGGVRLHPDQHEGNTMAKGMDQKKNEKKKPEKTMKEKKAAKKDKKANKAFAPT
jgi:hypothetical protein